MKIVFCGPPHSGKSVFIANLVDTLPSDAYTIIRACPDGEGIWSNNQNQRETSRVRKKGTFTKSFIKDTCQAIDKQTNKIVLVDVGGAISKENKEIMKHCDSFVVISNEKVKKREWLEFGEKLGLECMGCFDSSLEGQEEIYARDPFLQGNIVGLERGKLLENSPIIKGMASDMIRKSKYAAYAKPEQETFAGVMIENTEWGFALGCGTEIEAEDGTPIKKVTWQEKAIPAIYEAIQQKVQPNTAIRINGIRANFALAAICKAISKQGITDISTYDIRSKQYIPIRNLPKKRGIQQAEGLSYTIIENAETIFMDIDITKETYTLEDYKKCILPKIKEKKNLFLSGKIPLWLLASISNSYNANRIFTFQPGKGFTCIASANEQELGTMVEEVKGIPIHSYFEDKKEKQTATLPAVIPKQGIWSKVRAWVASRKEKKELSKYREHTIVAQESTREQHFETEKNKFQLELKKGVPSEIKTIEQTSSNTTKQPERVPTDRGE